MAMMKTPYARAVLKLADGDQVSLPVWVIEQCQPSGDHALARIAADYTHDSRVGVLEGQLIRQSDKFVLGTWTAPT